MAPKRIRMADARLDGQEMAAVIDCMMKGNLRAGKYVAELERNLSWRVSAHNTVAVANGTTALYMVFKAILEPGDRVIIPAFNFIAAANAVVMAGGVPVFVDVDLRNWMIDAEKMEEALDHYHERGERVAAVCPVHLFGAVCDIDEVERIAEKYGAAVVFDACQAFGAAWKENPIGGRGSMTVYSFYPTKPLYGAEGGAICYPVEWDSIGALSFYPMREHGWTGKKYVSTISGGNFRMNELSAAIVWAQLAHGLQKEREARRIALAHRMRERLAAAGMVQVQETIRGANSVYSVLAMFVRPEARDYIRERLNSDGIETAIHYPVGLNRQPSMRSFAANCPITDLLCSGVLSAPCHHGMDKVDADRVVDSILNAFKG